MARAAGSNDPEVVIVKFISRNETRAGLLDERGQVLRRRAGLDAEHQQLSAKCAAPPTKRPPPPSCPPHASGSTPPLTRLSPPRALAMAVRQVVGAAVLDGAPGGD